jgi:hypothetical protein
MSVWALLTLVSGGLFAGGASALAWDRVPAWRSMPLPEFRTDFAGVVQRADRVQPGLLAAAILASFGFGLTGSGAARILALIRGQADRDAIASRLLRYRDERGDDWADISDLLTLHAEARQQVVRLLMEIDARDVWQDLSAHDLLSLHAHGGPRHTPRPARGPDPEHPAGRRGGHVCIAHPGELECTAARKSPRSGIRSRVMSWFSRPSARRSSPRPNAMIRLPVRR